MVSSYGEQLEQSPRHPGPRRFRGDGTALPGHAVSGCARLRLAGNVGERATVHSPR